MKVRLDGDSLCSYIVSSESETDVEYVVDLCAHPLGLDADGNMQFNGACVMTRKNDEWIEHGCRDFIFRCEPIIKRLQPGEIKFHRCKHLKYASEYAFKLLLPHLAKRQKNIPDDQMP